jgi:NAD(P)-dependent dehydrogenase (short-subunit alcohol dehydrogenase family)
MTGQRRALVTGASAGLGAHLATRLAEDGWRVLGLGRRRAAEVSAVPGVDYVSLDLSAPDAASAVGARLDDVPDLVVHNAVSYPVRSGGVSEPAELEAVFRVNALLPYRLTADLLVRKPDEQFCSVVMVNSESMFHADATSGEYGASKAALRVLTSALATSCRGRNASVSTLLLGPLGTPARQADIGRAAEKRGVPVADVTRLFLRRSNPDMVIDFFIDLESCYRSLRYLVDLGRVANGTVCRLDGGSAGSLI